MPKVTELSARNAAPSSKQYTIWDTSVPGFGLRVNPGGSKTWTLVTGVRRERITIGRYPLISLAEARDAARHVLARRTLIRHTPQKIKFADAFELFLMTHCARLKPRTKYGYETTLRRHFLKRFGHLDLADIGDVNTIIDGLLTTPTEANHAFQVIRCFFRWAVRRRYLQHSPCEGLQAPTRYVPRDRVLEDGELLKILSEAQSAGKFGQIVWLCILTGQRRSEIGALRGEYFDRQARTITLPASVTKNRRQHTFPYGNTVARMLVNLPEQGWLFPGRGTGESFNSWSKCKDEFDKQCGLEHWVLHDLRRTFATGLARLGVAPHVVEKLLNHITGTISGVAAIYNRFQYQKECREAVTLWDDHIRRLLARTENKHAEKQKEIIHTDQRPSLRTTTCAFDKPRLKRYVRE